MIKRAKSILELYEEVKDFDLVITNDAPLATALNKLVEKSRLGYLAMTPRQIASKYAQLYCGRIYEKHEIVLEISNKEKISLSTAVQIAEKIIQVWNHNAKFEFAERFLSDEEKSFLKYFRDFETIESVMENFNEDFYGDKKIAVIGQSLFNLLDLEVIPKRGAPPARIEIFKESHFEIPKTYLFTSSSELIEKIISLINKENADESAIVLNPQSSYLEILKSRLNENGIGIQVKNFLSDDISTRSILSFMNLCMNLGRISVREFSFGASIFNIEIDTRYFGYSLKSYSDAIANNLKLKKIIELMEKITSLSYMNFFSALSNEFGIKINSELLSIIRIMELSEKKITENNFIELKFFLQTFDAELSSESNGVLFVDAKNSSFIDRQIVIYIGLDESWTTLYPDKEFLSKDDELNKSLDKFQILLQQGNSPFYFAQLISGNAKVVPCYYFNMLEDSALGTFENKFFRPEFCNTIDNPGIYIPAQINLKHITEPDIETISPSRLNKYFSCPKSYSFERNIPQEEKMVMKRGSLIHNFAELYFNDPEFTSVNVGKIKDIIFRKLNFFSDCPGPEILKTETDLCIRAVTDFIDNARIEKNKLEVPEETDNELMMELGIKKIYNNTELRFKDKEITLLSGRIDLQYNNNIVDYKTAALVKSEQKTLSSSLIGAIELNKETEFNFQTPSYIAFALSFLKNVTFTYNFLLGNKNHLIDSSNNAKKNSTIISYISINFLDYIISDTAYQEFKSKDQNLSKHNQGPEIYKRVVENLNLSPDEFFDKKLLEARIEKIFFKTINEMGLSYSSFGRRTEKTFRDNEIKQLVNLISGFRLSNYIYKDDIENFLTMIKQRIPEINNFQKTKFPFEPVFGSRDICKKCEFLNICIGNKLWN